MPATFGRALLILLAIATLPTPAAAQSLDKLDPLLHRHVAQITGHSRVIARAADPSAIDSLAALIQQAGGTLGRPLPIIGAVAADVPNASLPVLANSPLVKRLALDRSIRGAMNRTAATIGVDAIRQELGYDGSGIGVAVIDSGVAPWHDDLAGPQGGAGQRVEAFVDFVRGEAAPYDDYGHGTHVAGIVAGNGFDSGGARAGIAPGAHLVVLKVLDGSGHGCISDVIAAIGYAVEHRDAFRIRIINLSIGAGVFESYATDMLTLATKEAVDRGIVVVASAGNAGKDSRGRARYGSITAPGNAPWVLTVGASSHMGTVERADDTVAGFSSRGPTAIDRVAKPDLVAPGVGIESLIHPSSLLYTSKAPFLLNGSVPLEHSPYLSLSGTSQAAPVVSGVVALMLQANPSLTPNLVRGLLQYTAEASLRYDTLTQGAGFVDARGAIALARFLAAPDTTPFPADTSSWSGRIIWGNHLVRPEHIAADSTAWQTGITWGAATAPGGASITWNLPTVTVATITSDPLTGVTTVSWMPMPVQPDNVVWGTACGGANCGGSYWSAENAVVWGTCDGGDTVVWGSTDEGDTVVWGSSDDGETVVWGSSGDEDVVWDRSGEEPAQPVQ